MLIVTAAILWKEDQKEDRKWDRKGLHPELLTNEEVPEHRLKGIKAHQKKIILRRILNHLLWKFD